MPEQIVLTPIEKATVIAGVHTATGNAEGIKAVFREILENGYDFAPVREAMLTVTFIAGAPRVIEALFALSEVCEETGHPYPDFPEDTLPGGPARYRAKGEEVMRLVYGPKYEAFAKKIAALDGEFWSWLQGDAYGKCLGRPGLDYRMRELTIAGILCALDRPMQVVTHINGALNAGGTADEIEAVIELVTESGYDTSGARKTWERIRQKRISGE